MNGRLLAIALIALAMFYGARYAARSQVQVKPILPATAPAKTEPKVTKLNVRFATMSHDDATETSQFKSAVITDAEEGTAFRADLMKVKNKRGVQTADATGSLLVTDKQADVTGETAVIHFAKSRRLAVLTGSVTIQIKPTSEQKVSPTPTGPAPLPVPSGVAKTGEKTTGVEKIEGAKTDVPKDDEAAASARKYPATITCDKVEYEYARDKKHATLTGSFKVVQKLPNRTRTLWADHAEWFGLEDRLVLSAPVRWEDTKDEMKGTSPGDVTVFTKEGDERIEMPKGGEVELKFRDDDETPTPGGGTSTKPPTGKNDGKTDGKTSPPKTGPDKKALR